MLNANRLIPQFQNSLDIMQNVYNNRMQWLAQPH